MRQRYLPDRAAVLLLTFAVCAACVLGAVLATGCAGGEGATVTDGRCLPECDWRYCGDDDGCGGTCGCLSGAQCIDWTCVMLDAVQSDDAPLDSTPSDDQCLGLTCTHGGACCFGQCCASGEQCLPGGVCGPPCVPDCRGRTCGGDGCGGSCGDCGPDCLCYDGTCQCDTICPSHSQCGDQCCGDQQTCCLDRECCDDDQTCIWGPTPALFFCCTPSCDGRNCGPDRCGGSCGTCPAGHPCLNGLCDGKPLAPVPKCGDGICQTSETCATCASDCACAPGDNCLAGVCVDCQDLCTKAGADCGLLQGCNCGTCPGACDTCKANQCVEDCNCRCTRAGATCGKIGGCSCGQCSGTCNLCLGGDCVPDCDCRCKAAGATCGAISGGCNCGGCAECETCAEGGCKLNCKSGNCPCRGRIDLVKASLQGDLFGDDELDVRVEFHNSGRCPALFRVLLLTKSGQQVDSEPDVGWKPVEANKTGTLNLSTAYDWDFSAADLKAGFEVRLLCGSGTLADSIVM
jgi:hypothetical protein